MFTRWKKLGFGALLLAVKATVRSELGEWERGKSTLPYTHFTHISIKIKPIQIHHLAPRRYEVARKRLPGVIARVDLRNGSELRV